MAQPSQPAQRPGTPDGEVGVGWSERFLFASRDAEADFIRQSMQDIQVIQGKNRRKGHAKVVRRAFHAKLHAGIVNARFVVAAEIPQWLRVGLFQPGRCYRAMVRFSNASGLIQADQAKDLRGLAVRIYDDDGRPHDFLGTNAAASHERNAFQFMEFAKAAAGSRLLLIPRLLWVFGLRETWRMLSTVSRQFRHRVLSLSSERYWSRAPYAFGPVALKFIWSPGAGAPNVPIPAQGDQYLRQGLADQLKLGPIHFDFQVQPWVSDLLTPIEDASVEWLETDTAPITLGQLILPAQDLDSEAARGAAELVEQASFNPWTTTAPFRPLGSQNRARKRVYRASSDLRHAPPAGSKCPFSKWL